MYSTIPMVQRYGRYATGQQPRSFVDEKVRRVRADERYWGQQAGDWERQAEREVRYAGRALATTVESWMHCVEQQELAQALLAELLEGGK